MSLGGILWLYHVNGSHLKSDYDTYSDFVVAAYSPQEASLYHPSGCLIEERGPYTNDWVTLDQVHLLKVTCIGLACSSPDMLPGAVICASFHAG